MTQTAVPFDFEQARFNMIEQQVRPWEVLDSRVLALLNRVHREDFVPDAYRLVALADLEVPLNHGAVMLAPKVQARMVQDLDLQPSDNVLHIGTGSGYTAALLGHLAKQVLSLEIHPDLADAARANLQRAGVTNVTVKTANAASHRFAACASEAPYDAIVVSGAMAQVPADLLDLLKNGGRLWSVVGYRATVVRKVAEGQYHTAQPWDTVAPQIIDAPVASAFTF